MGKGKRTKIAVARGDRERVNDQNYCLEWERGWWGEDSDLSRNNGDAGSWFLSLSL